MRHRLAPPLIEASSGTGRPVLLCTLGVPIDERAAAFAVDTAVETGQLLIVANVTVLEPLRMSIVFGYDALEDFTPEVAASTRAPAALAASLGVRVERLRVRSPRPMRAVLELAGERDAGIIVFGSDRTAMRARAYARAVRALRDGATCLVWVRDM